LLSKGFPNAESSEQSENKMALEFTNVVKGAITQTLVTAILERGGYRVTRLGIEELFGEIKHLDLKQYMKLNLPLELRTLPDLLVADSSARKAFLVEVKFRREFDEISVKWLHDDLIEQRKYWPQAYAVILVSNSLIPDGKFHQDYIRVLKPSDDLSILLDRTVPLLKRWDKLHHMQRVFTQFNADQYILDVQKSADSITQTLRDLSKLNQA